MKIGVPELVTEELVIAPWMGGKNGKWFKCQLCGYRFVVGDYYYMYITMEIAPNLLVCEDCDTSDVTDLTNKYISLEKEYETFVKQRKFWYMRKQKRCSS